MLCPACLLVPFVVATNQLANKVVLVDGTSCANLKTSTATLLSVDFLRTLALNYTLISNLYISGYQCIQINVKS